MYLHLVSALILNMGVLGGAVTIYIYIYVYIYTQRCLTFLPQRTTQAEHKELPSALERRAPKLYINAEARGCNLRVQWDNWYNDYLSRDKYD